MRLHRLEVTAFGPFAETATVDFEALSAAGLFLLSGATGSGKTSVLDAVCFALYGAVPGERNDAKRRRSTRPTPRRRRGWCSTRRSPGAASASIAHRPGLDRSGAAPAPPRSRRRS